MARLEQVGNVGCCVCNYSGEEKGVDHDRLDRRSLGGEPPENGGGFRLLYLTLPCSPQVDFTKHE